MQVFVETRGSFGKNCDSPKFTSFVFAVSQSQLTAVLN